jgi:hypothetical protein
MQWWETLLDSLGAVVALIAAMFVLLFIRRRVLGRSGGIFECSVRLNPPAKAAGASAARGWTLGLGRYAGDSLEWFRVFSFSPRPRRVFSRSMSVLSRRTPQGVEAFSLYAGHRVIEIQLESGQRVELAMSESALTGFLAWTEAAPPGHDRLLA